MADTNGVVPAGQAGATAVTRSPSDAAEAVRDAELTFQAMMVESLISSGFAQSNLMKGLPGNDVAGSMRRMQAEEDRLVQELEQQREEDEREAERA